MSSRYCRSVVSTFFVLTIGLVTTRATAQAASFDQQEVNPSQVVAIAAPIGHGTEHKLLILEQLTQRPCWRETGSAPTLIQMAMMDYQDFTGLCSRSIDSNGFSVRMAGQDLALDYSLRIEARQHDLVLLAYPTRDRRAPTLEIGHTNGTTSNFAKIQLAPGWRLTRRIYNGQPLGHIYLTHDQALSQVAAPQSSDPLQPQFHSPPPEFPPLLLRPNAGSVVVQPISYRPKAPIGNVVVPVIESGYATPPGQSPFPVQSPVPVPTLLPPMPWPSASFRDYRVVVAANASQAAQIKRLVPDAFRTVINGQSVMQVGRFSDRATAIQRQQQLRVANLPAQVIESSNLGIQSPIPQPYPPMAAMASTNLVNFNLPEPDRGSLGTPLTLWSTYYYRHQAQTVSGGNPLLDLQGNSLGVALSDRDWCHAALQGSVQVMAGSQAIGTFNYAGRGEQPQVDCSLYYPNLKQVADTNRVRFKVSNAPYGNGAGGLGLVPFRSIAVDPSQIAIGSLLYIPQARGTVITLPSGQQVTHDGYFYAVDVGNAIRGNHIDTFIGSSQTNPFRYVTSSANGTFAAYVINQPNWVTAMRMLHQSATSVAQR